MLKLFWSILSFVLVISSTCMAESSMNVSVLPPQLQELINNGQLNEEQIRQAEQSFQSKELNAVKFGPGHKSLNESEIKAGLEMLKAGEVEEEQPGLETEGIISEEDAGLRSFLQRIFGPELPEDLRLFGSELFMGSPESFDPVKDMPVSNDYIIGPGDVVEILMWGRLDASYSLEVDKEGVIFFPQIGPLTVIGLTFDELDDLITSKAESITGVNVAISMGKLRTFQVFVLGEVARPGIHTITSLSTAVNGLLTAGGPTMLGSLRNVQIKRQGDLIAEVDLYDFLLHGDISLDNRLMPSDVVFVPQSGPLVAVAGNVKRPAVYELKGRTSLQQVLGLAGGLAPRGDNQRVQISRAEANQLEVVVDVPYDQLLDHESVVLKDGDIVEVFSVVAKVENAVYLNGNVKRPGKYAFREGLNLNDLLPHGIKSLKDDTYLDYGLIRRYHSDQMDVELIPFDLGEMLQGSAEKQIPLHPLDKVTIFSRWEFEDIPQATISGEIRVPGSYEIRRMRVRDLIFKAGNLTHDAYLNMGHLYRTDRYTKKVSILTFNVAKALDGHSAHNFLLQDFDRLEIHAAREYVPEYIVSAQGMVNSPGEYPLAENMTVKDLLLVAGNVKDSAFLKGAEVVRSTIVAGKEVLTSLVSIDLHKAMAGDSEHNINLQPWDVLIVKQVPDWGESRQVTILGEVLFPGTYTIMQDELLSSIFERAGGFTDDAYFGGARFIRESVRVQQQERLDELVNRLSEEMAKVTMDEMAAASDKADIEAGTQIMAAQQMLIDRLRKVEAEGRVVIKLAPGPAFERSAYNLVLQDNDTIHIPRKPETVSIAGEVYNPTSLIYNTEESKLSFYLSQVGGPTSHADIDQMYIIRTNGTVLSASQSSGFGASLLSSFNDMEIYPGDTLVVPPKLIQISWQREMMDMSRIFYELAVSAGILITQVFN